MSIRKIGLDARMLEHPAPLEMAMKILQDLDDTAYLYMLHRINPVPLLDLANENNFQVISQEDSKQEWHILISKNKTVNLTDYLNV